MENFAEELKKLKFDDYENNKYILSMMQKKLINKFPALNDVLSIGNLYKSTMDEGWLLAQCQSANNQINKILDADSKFLEYYSEILTEYDFLLYSKEIIYDLCYLDRLSGYQLDFDSKISRSNYLASSQFFLRAKFSFFTKKHIPETTNRHFLFSSMPTLIRQAIELKIKNMIGLERITSKNGGFKIVSISQIIKFIDERNDLFDMPLPMSTLSVINEWTNNFTHTGITPFCWQSLEAIDLIECLFSMEDEETGEINMDGFSYIAKGISLDSIKLALNDNFNAEFFLNPRSIEGTMKK